MNWLSHQLRTPGVAVLLAITAAAGCGAPSGAGPTPSHVTPPTQAVTASPTISREPSVAPRPSPKATNRVSGDPLVYVALGDSILYALEEDCDRCISAVTLFAEQMERDLGRPVEVHNLTMHNSLTSAGLLAALREDQFLGRVPEKARPAVARADVITVSTGFNDIGVPLPMGPTEQMKPLAKVIDAILDEIASLRKGKPTALRVTELYNNGGSGFSALTEAANQLLCDAAAAHEGVCVNVYRAFNGADGMSDPVAMGLLGDDQTHPSQLGMDLIAAELVAAGYAPFD